jgi:hypothetical protein
VMTVAAVAMVVPVTPDQQARTAGENLCDLHSRNLPSECPRHEPKDWPSRNPPSSPPWMTSRVRQVMYPSYHQGVTRHGQQGTGTTRIRLDPSGCASPGKFEK